MGRGERGEKDGSTVDVASARELPLAVGRLKASYGGYHLHAPAHLEVSFRRILAGCLF